MNTADASRPHDGLAEVLHTLFAGGGSVIDSSPILGRVRSAGRSERGRINSPLGNQEGRYKHRGQRDLFQAGAPRAVACEQLRDLAQPMDHP